MGPARHQGRRLSDTLPVLPDILEPGLDSVFCGSAASTVSARKGSYYAGPGNKFWPTLHAMGLTPRLLKPEEFRTLPDYGLGLTDMTKHASGSDASLPKDSDDPEALRGKIERYRPASSLSSASGQLRSGSAIFMAMRRWRTGCRRKRRARPPCSSSPPLRSRRALLGRSPLAGAGGDGEGPVTEPPQPFQLQ